jgi:hypothetical protein
MITTDNPQAPPTVIPVLNGERPVGAWIVGPEAVSYRPVVDVTRLAVAALAGTAAVGVVAVAVVAALRRRPAIGTVTMGPGGWVSVKGLAEPRPRAESARPWWARLLRAHRLVTTR